MAEKTNNYRKVGGLVIGSNTGMAKLYKPKVLVCREILNLSAFSISQFFGVVGQHYVEAIRYEMITELNSCNTPVCSWREIATKLQGREELLGFHTT